MTRMINRSRRNPSFIKLLFNDFSKMLLIPPKFVRLHRETLPKKCTLKLTGTQSSWPVRTKLIDNHLYFKNGWKSFAQHHSLQHGDMLIFRSAQDSEFYVDMFDKTCCLREPVTTSTACLREPVTTSTACLREPVTTSTACLRETVTTSTACLREPVTTSTACLSEPVTTSTACLRESVTTSTALILPEQETKDDPETAADELILTSKFPSFQRTMQKTYVRSNGYLQIPLEFARTYMKEITNYSYKLVFLDKVWIIESSRTDRPVFQKGWSEFAKENSLKLGDVCVFQLISAKDNTLKVTILRNSNKRKGNACRFTLRSASSRNDVESKECHYEDPLKT